MVEIQLENSKKQHVGTLWHVSKWKEIVHGDYSTEYHFFNSKGKLIAALDGILYEEVSNEDGTRNLWFKFE